MQFRPSQVKSEIVGLVRTKYRFQIYDTIVQLKVSAVVFNLGSKESKRAMTEICNYVFIEANVWINPELNPRCPAVTSPSGNALFFAAAWRWNVNHINRFGAGLCQLSFASNRCFSVEVRGHGKSHINLAKAEVTSGKSRWLQDTWLWDRMHCFIVLCLFFLSLSDWRRTRVEKDTSVHNVREIRSAVASLFETNLM